MMKKHFLYLLSIVFCNCALAQSKHSKTSAFTSYKGLVMAGYQGWFNSPDDGAKRGWNHYKSRGEFVPGSIKVDMWPDVSEYKVTYKTPFKLPDSSAAYLFSSYDKTTVDLHFKWMQQYGVDGVFVQRFISNIKNKTSLHHNDRVLSNALDAAEKNHRAISLMYDLSGMRNEDVQLIIDDWKHLVDSLKMTGRGKDQSYLYHNGKPLIALWGVGFAKRQYLLSNIEKIINFLKNDPIYGGCSIMLGVPGYWRDLTRDTEPDPHLLEVIRGADIVNPWFVGRYDEAKYPDFKDHIAGDVKWCADNHVDYVPTIYPGFSWHNMYPNSPQNQMPRNKGQFFWKQISGDISVGAKMLYVAMFDEIDEGTAIFKISKNPPVGKSNFVKFEDGIPNDYYLYLAGYAGKILKKQIPLPDSIPLPVAK